jgi:hypothetical protein
VIEYSFELLLLVLPVAANPPADHAVVCHSWIIGRPEVPPAFLLASVSLRATGIPVAQFVIKRL